MTTTARSGSPQFPTVAGSIPSSTQEAMDEAVNSLQVHKVIWAALSIADRISLLDRLTTDFVAIAPHWVDASAQAKGFAVDSPLAGEEWGAGVWPVVEESASITSITGPD